MNNMKNILYVGLFSLCGMAFTACDDEETYDVMGEKNNLVYLREPVGNFKFIHTPVTSASTLNYSIAVRCTQNAATDIRATIEVDESLVVAYNEENQTEYEAFPEEALVFENRALTIPQGEILSNVANITADQSKIAELRSEKGYLLALKVGEVKGGKPSRNVNTAFVIVSTVIDSDMIDESLNDSDTQGTIVSDRQGWNIEVESENEFTETGSVDKAFDEDTNSSWKIKSSESFAVIFDLAEERDVTALRCMYRYYGYYDYLSFAKDTKIESSTNGTDWSEVGVLSKGSGWGSPINTNFYAPVKARYFKATIPVVSSWSGSSASIEIGDFKVYVK